MIKTRFSNRLLKLITILIITIMVFKPVAVIAAQKAETNPQIIVSAEASAIDDGGVALSSTAFIDETSGQDYYWLFLLFILIAGIATEELIRIHYQKTDNESKNK